MFQLTIVPIMSDLVVTFCSSSVLLTSNAKSLDCATAAFNERPNDTGLPRRVRTQGESRSDVGNPWDHNFTSIAAPTELHTTVAIEGGGGAMRNRDAISLLQ